MNLRPCHVPALKRGERGLVHARRLHPLVISVPTEDGSLFMLTLVEAPGRGSRRHLTWLHGRLVVAASQDFEGARGLPARSLPRHQYRRCRLVRGSPSISHWDDPPSTSRGSDHRYLAHRLAATSVDIGGDARAGGRGWTSAARADGPPRCGLCEARPRQRGCRRGRRDREARPSQPDPAHLRTRVTSRRIPELVPPKLRFLERAAGVANDQLNVHALPAEDLRR